jgi:HD-GYP domain-containing protein (c-di-GMP phosphodiesterase class II)
VKERTFSKNSEIDTLLHDILDRVQSFAEEQLDHIEKLNEIGAALSAESQLERLLEQILVQAKRFTYADGGTLYLVSDDEKHLKFTVVQTDSLGVKMGGSSGEITWPELPLFLEDGSQNRQMVAAMAALTGEIVNIPDVYKAEGFNFEGTRKFDASTGYRSTSMLVIPMKNHDGEVIGVCQLLNRIDPISGKVTPFSHADERTAKSLASQAAVAISNTRLINDLRNLLESFIDSIAAAIDAKSPYTGGHVRKVAEITMMTAQALSEAEQGGYEAVHYDFDQMNQLRISALMHDVGKITTPEYVVDKATKLETIFDRIELIKTRYEVLKRDAQIACLKAGNRAEDQEVLAGTIAAYDEEIAFLERANIGGEFMADEKIAQVEAIASRQYTQQDQTHPLLTPDEVHNLSIRKGTLTEKERDIINDHAAMSLKMLQALPFPKKLRRVPEIAANHHEKLNGKGYPRGLSAEDLTLEARILALADIFEALTAADRPYKEAKKMSEAMKIIGFMVKDGELDGDLVKFFFDQKLHLLYGRKNLKPEQMDMAD